MSKSKVGVAFAGGGLRAFSQIATLYELQAQNIAISSCAGTSMGSAIAALVACGLSADQIEKKLLELEIELKKLGLFSRPNFRVLPFLKDRIDGLISHQDFSEFVVNVFNDLGFKMLSDVKMPLCICATRLNDGKLVLFTNNKKHFSASAHNSMIYEKDIELGKAVAASCCFPFVFSTALIDTMRLIDGGVRMNCPSEVFNRKKIDRLLALTQNETDYKEVSQSPFNVGMQAVIITMRQLDAYAVESVDVHINVPLNINYTFDIGKGKEVIDFSKQYLKTQHINYQLLKKRRWFK